MAERATSQRSDHSSLTSRQKSILKAIVEDYITAAEPVASKNLLEAHRWDISSATVRKEMAELEQAGFLEQPHTSAGRVPTDQGYRAYVDELLTPYQLRPQEVARLNSLLEQNLAEVEAVIRGAAAALSVVTGLTALVVLPQYEQAELKKLHLILIEPGRALCVLILSAGTVKDRRLEIDADLDQLRLQAIALAIQEAIAGHKLNEIDREEIETALLYMQLSPDLAQQLAQNIYRVIAEAQSLEVYVQGEHLLLQQPEFHDPQRANLTFSELQKESGLATYLQPSTRMADGSELLIKIGSELAFAGLSDLSLISACYQYSPGICGQIAVIGPRRMAYSSIISNVKYLRQSLSDEKTSPEEEKRGKE